MGRGRLASLLLDARSGNQAGASMSKVFQKYKRGLLSVAFVLSCSLGQSARSQHEGAQDAHE